MRVVLAVPFFTLLERKILGYIQLRKGPNKVGILGLLQAISDGGKLLLKKFFVINKFKNKIFFFSPFLSFFLMLLIWFFVFPVFGKSRLYLGLILFLCISRLNVYSILGSGWGSNSKYSLLGGLRGAVQSISYEVSLVIILFLPCCFNLSYNLSEFFDKYSVFLLIFYLKTVMWFIRCLAETNRSPFDFSEGESELVSGFNTEYSSAGFVLLFLSEYGKILFISFLTILLFFPINKVFFFILLGKMIGFCFIWIRGCLPRFRYDLFMKLMWKGFLPFSLINLLIIFLI